MLIEIPGHHLSPLIRSVVSRYPDFDLKTLDIVADRRPLRHLLKFVGGNADDFEFGAGVLGTSVLFTRMENQSRQVVLAGKVQGYRRAFGEAYTKILRSAEGSTSHHRVIGYRLGSLRLLIRSTIDAYSEDEVAGREQPTSRRPYSQDDPINFMKAASLASDAPSIDPKSTRCECGLWWGNQRTTVGSGTRRTFRVRKKAI
jgi:hypothetical protein